jgi:hypothetical protein
MLRSLLKLRRLFRNDRGAQGRRDIEAGYPHDCELDNEVPRQQARLKRHR